MLLRRHKLNAVRKGNPDNEIEDRQQADLYQHEVQYEEKEDETVKYTKTDINRMSKEDLVSLASEVGIIGVEDKSGSDLKKELIDKFGL